MSFLLDEAKLSLIDGFQSRTLTSCSRWAKIRRVMGEPFPGPYSWHYHPWVRELHDSWAPFNCAMKAAQMGVTEVGINRALYTIDKLKRDVLYVLPTALNASDFSKARFGAALSLSPYLKSIFTDTNTVNLKQAGANVLYIRGSRGDSNLKSVPASELILDEVDEMDQKQIWLALERLSGQREKHVWAISTPTVHNHGVHKLFLSSTQEHFYFKCPHCSRRTELVWPDCVEICGETVSDPRCKESFLKCKECKHRLEHNDKPSWLEKGIWEGTAPNGNADFRGFYINQLYSFTVTPVDLVIAYHRGFGDEYAAKEFHNSKLGLPYVGEGAQVTDKMLDNCVANHTIHGERPQVGGERFITMGVDQGKWSYVSIVDWTIGDSKFDINANSVGKLVWYGKFHETDWHMLDELMREWQVLACVIDADPQINEARRFAKRFPGYVWLSRYRRGVAAKEIATSEDEAGAPMTTVDRTNWLTASLGRFKTDPPRLLLPRDVSLEYREHIKSLVRTYELDEFKNPVATFKETGPDHYAHSLNYAEIALPLAGGIGAVTGEFATKLL